MLKKIVLYTDSKDTACIEILGFLTELEIFLQVHDIRKDPLNTDQIARLLRHFNLGPFVNEKSPAYKKHKLDKGFPEREEFYQLMADNNDLLRLPIIEAGRLMTVGCNIDKIKEMLQISDDGTSLNEDIGNFSHPRRNNGKPRHRSRE